MYICSGLIIMLSFAFKYLPQIMHPQTHRRYFPFRVWLRLESLLETMTRNVRFPTQIQQQTHNDKAISRNMVLHDKNVFVYISRLLSHVLWKKIAINGLHWVRAKSGIVYYKVWGVFPDLLHLQSTIKYTGTVLNTFNFSYHL